MGKGITGAAAESREAVRVLDTGADPRYIPSHPGIRSELAVPLIVQDRVVGVLDVESDRIAYFTEDHQRTLSLLATQIASSVENARLYEELAQREQRMDQDLKAARKLQRVLMPRDAPDIKGLEIGIRSPSGPRNFRRRLRFLRASARLRPDRLRRRQRERRGGGALRSAGQRAAAHSGAAAVQARASHQGSERTAAGTQSGGAVRHAASGAMGAGFAASSAWPPPVRSRPWCSAAAKFIKPKVEGVPIGLLEDREYEEVELMLEPGDTILFYSDGVEDQLNAKEEDYSRARVSRLLTKRAQLAPQAIADAFFADLDKFRGETPITDDQTLVVVASLRVKPVTYQDRALAMDGVELSVIAAKAGTPCYVYSAAAILENFRAYDAAFGDTPHTVCYAVKANGNLALLRLLAAGRRGLRHRLRRRTVPRAQGRRRSRQDRFFRRRQNRRGNRRGARRRASASSIANRSRSWPCSIRWPTGAASRLAWRCA